MALGGLEILSTEEIARKVGTCVGRAIARDVLAHFMPHEWTGLTAQDGDQLTAAGLELNTDAWRLAERCAEDAYWALIAELV